MKGKETIENSLHATGKFSTDECEEITQGILKSLADDDFTIRRSGCAYNGCPTGVDCKTKCRYPDV